MCKLGQSFRHIRIYTYVNTQTFLKIHTFVYTDHLSDAHVYVQIHIHRLL